MDGKFEDIEPLGKRKPSAPKPPAQSNILNILLFYLHKRLFRVVLIAP
jgi:hypothetical protein